MKKFWFKTDKRQHQGEERQFLPRVRSSTLLNLFSSSHKSFFSLRWRGLMRPVARSAVCHRRLSADTRLHNLQTLEVLLTTLIINHTILYHILNTLSFLLAYQVLHTMKSKFCTSNGHETRQRKKSVASLGCTMKEKYRRCKDKRGTVLRDGIIIVWTIIYATETSVE